MRRLYPAIFLLLLAAPAQAAWESIPNLYQKEDAGLRYYERGEYAQAFEKLSETAIRGLKKSQYILAFMFMKGQHVDKSTLLAMAWLGVAKESEEKEWVDLYNSLYERMQPAQKAMIDDKVAEYVEWYGGRAQNVECGQRQASVGSRRIESRCIKVEGPQYEIHPIELRP